MKGCQCDCVLCAKRNLINVTGVPVSKEAFRFVGNDAETIHCDHELK
jgi:hypothetical protein